MRRLILLIIALAVFGLTLAMVLVNLSQVRVGYLFGTTHLPLAVVMIIALVLGMLVGALCLLPAVIRARTRARRMQGKLDALEKEIHNLRHVPLRDAH